MLTNRVALTSRTAGKLACLGLVAGLAMASPTWADARLFLVRQGDNPNTPVPGTPISVTINSGQSVTFYVYIDDTSPDNLKGWQVTLPCFASGGALGTFGFVAPPSIDQFTNPDWVFAGGGFTVFPAIDSGQCDPALPCVGPTCPGSSTCTAGFCTLAHPRAVAAVLQAVGPVVTTPKYLATFTYTSSAASSGQFTLNYVTGADDSFLRRGPDNAAIPVTFDGALINVRCQSNAHCDDGNACTTDSCNIGTGACTNTNSTPGGQCCDPSDGSLTPISDNNDCTSDSCNTATGNVTHSNLTNGTACGNPASTQCDQPDTCNGAGVCLTNIRPDGFACGNPNPTHPECDQPDSCDGAGTCLPRNSSAGTACGDPSDTFCSDPDTCNGSGLCVNNDVANGTPCDDGLICNEGESCTNGACGGGGPLDCSDGNQCTSDQCIEGVGCQSTNTTDPCDDGNPCTGTGAPGIGIDECDGAGNCVGLNDPNCNLNCETAVPVFEGVNSGFSNSSATEPDDAEASCQPNSNKDVWFLYNPSCSLDILVTTVGSVFTPFNDTVLSIYDECDGTEVACDDDGAIGALSAATFAATAGEDYYIRVAGFDIAGGQITINIRPASTDGCLIGGFCYNDGDTEPGNACNACIPLVSTTEWTPVAKGTPCGDPSATECTSPDACNGFGVCEENHKPDGIACIDDGAQCTFDLCNTGVCSHPPRPNGTPCGDPTDTECDNPDSCDGLGACDPRYETAGTGCGDPLDTQCDDPDTCNGTGGCLVNFVANGTPCNDLDVCTEADACDTGLCFGTPIPDPPVVAAAGARAIDVTPQPPGSPAPVALLLTGDPGNPKIDCLSLYIQSDGSLGMAPVFQLPADWGTVTVTGTEIIPSAQSGMTLIPTTYFVAAECGSFLTTPGSADTARWGDLNLDAIVNIDDILCVIAGFGGSFVQCTFNNVDILPCNPNGIIDIDDILGIISAFGGAPYPCADPCP